MEFFCNTKDRIPNINQYFVVYEFTCPGCRANYVRKTERKLYERCVAHTWSDQNSIVKNHLDQCVDNNNIIDFYKNFNILLFNEGLKVKANS